MGRPAGRRGRRGDPCGLQARHAPVHHLRLALHGRTDSPHGHRTGVVQAPPPEEREAIARRFWAEGRLKLEPWLTPRLDKPSVHRWPHQSVVACEDTGGDTDVRLSDGTRLAVDFVILGTGYKPDMLAVPYLAGVIEDMELADGFPVLDDNFQSSVPGLFVTGFPATRDFGPFFGFVRGCPVAATLTTAGLEKALGPTRA